MLKTRREKWCIGSLVLAMLLLPSLAHAAVIDVTVEPTEAHIGVGGKATLDFYGQLKVPNATSDNGIFSWALDLVVDDPSIAAVDNLQLDSIWTSDGSPGSSGNSTAWGIQGVYETLSPDGEKNRGRGSRVRLFSVDVTLLTEGTTSVFVRPDSSAFADPDFLTWGGNLGGDYTGASATVPEPASMALLALGGLLALRRKRK